MEHNEILMKLYHLKKNDMIERCGKTFITKKGFYFYDTGTSKVIKVDEGIYRLICELMNKDMPADIDSLINRLQEEYTYSLKEFIDAAARYKLFSAPPLEKLYSIYHNELLDNSLEHELNQIILEVTGKCNLRCGYCIYNEKFTGNRSFNQNVMTKEIAKQAIDYLQVHGGKHVAVTFYGGEPLLEYELVKWCIEYARDNIIGHDLSFSLTSNLTLLTGEMAQYFASVDKLSIVCSIDGPEQIHDEYRRHAGGEGTFREALRGLRFLVDSYGDKAQEYILINSVFTPPYTYEKLEEINIFFEELPWLPSKLQIEIGYAAEGSVNDTEAIRELQDNSAYQLENGKINPLYQWSRDSYLHEKQGRIYKKLIQEQLLQIHNRRIFHEPDFEYPFNACCVPGSRRLYIDALGDFYLCERIGTSPSIGNVFSGINKAQLRKYYIDDFSDYSVEMCSKCWAVRLCKRCYVGNYNADGYIRTQESKFCESMRETVKRELILYHSILETTPERLDYLNRIIIS